MITVREDNKILIVEYETGEDYQFLTSIKQLIELRNEDKEHIIGLKEELM